MGIVNSTTLSPKKVAIINTLADVYAKHRKFTGLFSRMKTAEWSNIFVSPTTLLIATLLKRMGCSVKIYSDLQKEIDPEEIDEDIILISAVTSSAKRAYEIAKLFPERKTILGGIHPSALPEEAGRYADHVVVGECETVLPDIISGKINKRIIYGEPLSPLDNLPFLDFSFLSSPPDVLPIQTSRGCNFRCNYCSLQKIYGKYRYRSPKHILSELMYYREQYGDIKKVDFRIDADFNFIRSRAKEIFNRMIAEEIKPKVVAVNSRLDAYKDRELLSLMSKHNIIFCTGIESLNQGVLDYYRKDQSSSDILEAIQILHDNNIKVLGYFMFGADQDDKDTLKRYTDFIHKSKLDFFHVSILTPYPGTELFDLLMSQKRIITTDWNYYDGLHLTYKPARMTAYEMQKQFIDFYQETFSMKSILNPRFFFNFELLRNKVMMSLLTKLFKNDLIDYLSFLKDY